MIIRETPADAIIELRRGVLRPHRPIEESHYPEDLHADTFHLGVYDEGTLIGCATALVEPAPGRQVRAYRLRGMAVLEAYRNRGIGGQLLAAVEAEAAKREASLLWCNGRVSAGDFYRRRGWVSEGEVFDIIGIPHLVFTKSISAL